jgi:hypothetical protein
LKQQTAARGSASNEPLFTFDFPEKIGRRDFKNPGKASPLLFHFGVRRDGRSLTLSTLAVSACHMVASGYANSVELYSPKSRLMSARSLPTS